MSEQQETWFTALAFCILTNVTDGWASVAFGALTFLYLILNWRASTRAKARRP